MTFTKFNSNPDTSQSGPAQRPRFNSHSTADRLREGTGQLPKLKMTGNIRKGRKSIFKELGLDGDDLVHTEYTESPTENMTRDYPGLGIDTRLPQSDTREMARGSQDDSETDDKTPAPVEQQDASPETPTSAGARAWLARLVPGQRPRIKQAASAPPPAFTLTSRFTMFALLIAVVLPCFSYNSGRGKVEIGGADAGVIPERPVIIKRKDSSTDYCTRWAQQVALVNGTLYLYGGQVKTRSDQENNTWNNDFLTLDLTKSWDKGSAALKGLPIPDGPPAVSMGYLWHDYNNLYLYGGEFADNPYVLPDPMSTWRYSIGGGDWTEFRNPRTSSGYFSTDAGEDVQRAAEGAGLSVPELGLSWYFGGHLDLATTPGWTNQVDRVYLKSLLEFTHPGYSNKAVSSLGTKGAPESGAYRNITEGGLQETQAFSERADGALVFVPGWGESGVLIGLAGGTADRFTNDLSTLDVYDIESSQWYHQQTKGDPPSVRVNPCVVIASAPDASSFNIYLYGGQNLQPYKEQIQYDDMYILTIPAFTWIKVKQGGDSAPAARAGHTCTMRDGQMVVVGGYIGPPTTDTSDPLACDSPGVYVFDASSLEWKGRFAAGDHAADLDADNTVKAGSWGYRVPGPVQSVVGGGPQGGATATKPAAGVAEGPFATGKPPVYTVTGDGAMATVTGPAAEAAREQDDRRRGGLIAAGVVAGLLGLAAGYLGFCAWVYRRQVGAYKAHMAVANRYTGAPSPGPGGRAAADGGRGTGAMSSLGSLRGVTAALFGRRSGGAGAGAGAGARASRNSGEKGSRRPGSADTQDTFAWVGQQATVEPKWLSDEATPGSGTTASGSGTASAPRWGRRSEDHAGSSAGGVSPYNGPGTYSSYYGGGGGGGGGGAGRAPRTSGSGGSTSSTENLLDGMEPSFFSVVLGPRKALRVVNGEAT